jgi:hypothetical protein
MEAKCLMKLTFPTNNDVTIESAVAIETSTANYFSNLFLHNNNSQEDDPTTKDELLPTSVYPLRFNVDVADSIQIGKTATVTGTVTLLYETNHHQRSDNEPLELASILSKATVSDQNDNSPPQFTFTTDSSFVVWAFDIQEKDASIVLDVRNGSTYSSAEIGLIVVTVFLSCVLLIVSSVLLYITGGWTICMTKITNCLFEEVDDDDDDEEEDNYVVHQKRTYPVQKSEDDEDDDHIDVESNMTSVPPSSASGILGVSRNKDLPSTALNIETPNSHDDDDDDESSMMYGDGMTPVSRSNQLPLGITSMRKLPQPDPSHATPGGTFRGGGGFSGMMMHRIARSASKK